MVTKEEAFNKVSALVKRFDEHVDYYKRTGFNEHQTRIDYINPFFKALGWDVDNEQGHAEAYREVIHEDKIKIGSATKAPDYAFTLYGQRKFFVDAKKPGIDIHTDIGPAYQVRRYGWSAKVPLSIVTDFEEFAIYDCTKKPKPTDKASVARIKYITYKQYLEEFDFLWEVFAKENLPKGRFDKYVQSDTRKKGTATVDEAFLQSMEEWRRYLAQSIALRNKTLSEDELNHAVQKTIDRIIFLRMCEDRGVELYGTLKQASEKGEIYANLFELFKIADDKYNSGLFDLREDRITPGLVIDNKVLKNIVRELYYPQSEYEFSVMPADILGSVYERFLGKTIRLTPAHHAKVEEKPEVRKAGGVYYTPKYVVDYIVENTLGKLLEGKTPEEVAKITVCDPACGSGSFLIGAYQYLLDWHTQYYLEQPPARKKGSPLTPEGKLTTDTKKQILLNNIYGVDIDPQAVEVTKLNLLLKALEGETQASINQQMQLFHERVLPNLGNNIQCGNSLIGPDFFDSQLELFPEQIKKVNAFDWQQGFTKVFENGGFSAVIGNPPYVRQELLGDQKAYFKTRYKVFHGMADLYVYFFEKGINILKEGGLFGIIVANKWMRARYGEALRQWLKKQPIREIIDFGDLPVFQQATTYPCIIIAGGASADKFWSTEVKTLDFGVLSDYFQEQRKQISRINLEDSAWQLIGDEEVRLLKKLQESSVTLGEYVKGRIFYGIKTGLNEAFVIDKETKNRLIKEDPASAEVIKPFLAGRDIKRYQPPVADKFLVFFPRGFTKQHYKGRQAWSWLNQSFPAIANYLAPFAEKAQKRWDKGDYWWELRACDYYDEFESNKLMLPDIALRMQATYDTQGIYCVNTAYIIPNDDIYLLSIVNSKLIRFFYATITSSIRGGYLRFIRQYLQKIPIKPLIIEDTPNEFSTELIQLVTKLLDLNRQYNSSSLSTHRHQLQRTIDHSERRIDELVYALYGLTDEEIRLVEESLKA